MIFGLFLLLFGAMISAPVMWENLPTCDYREPIVKRCREVRGQWGGTVDGRIVMPAGNAMDLNPRP